LVIGQTRDERQGTGNPPMGIREKIPTDAKRKIPEITRFPEIAPTLVK
jgi:hypothetical protein